MHVPGSESNFQHGISADGCEAKTSGRFGQAETMLHVPDYFHYLLTGKKTCEYTEATTGQLVNAETKDWDYELIDKLGYPRKMFQKLIMPCTSVGHFTEEVKAEVGFDVEVVAPELHMIPYLQSLASPANDDDFIYISSGTWSLMGIEREKSGLLHRILR